jgi:hypothetical protein
MWYQEKEGEMGEAEIKKSKGVSLTLHNWMGEPSDQDEDEKTLELSLGLPGGGGGQAGWRTASKHKGRRSTDADTSMLSLGYTAAALSPRSQGTAVWMLSSLDYYCTAPSSRVKLKSNLVLDLVALHYEIVAHTSRVLL